MNSENIFTKSGSKVNKDVSTILGQTGDSKPIVMEKPVNYIPAAANASLNLSLGNLAEAGVIAPDTNNNSGNGSGKQVKSVVAENISSDFTNRAHTITQSRYKKTLEHLSKFMRIQVNLEVRKSAGTDKQLIQMPILIEREKTVQDLARHVEAEYAFMNLHESIASTNADPECLIHSVQVIMIYDVGNVPLKFQSSVAEVLNNGDKALIVATLVENNLKMKSLIDRRIQIFRNLVRGENLTDQHKISGWNYESKMFALFHNLLGIQAFQEYCMQEFEIENLLFWLEVEVFRGTFRLACPEGTKNSMDQSNQFYGKMLLHARYIYFTFIAPESSLKLNVPSDLVSSVDWPLPKLDAVTGLHLPLRMDLWDELQEHVFLYLSHYVYPKFEQSECFEDWKIIMDATYDFPNADQGWFAPGEHHISFQQDVDGMEKAVREALMSSIGSRSNHTMELQQPAPALGPSHSPQIQSTNITRSNSVNTQAHSSSTKRHGTQTPGGMATVGSESDQYDIDVDLPPEFYGKGPKITNAQKLRRIQRDKKLKKFFGDNPQIKSDEPPTVSLREADSDEILSSLPVEITQKQDHQNAGDDDQVVKKKKADKLVDFFGAQLPPEQLFEQKLVDKIERLTLDASASTGEEVFIHPLKNELDAQTKVKLVQKKKKLRGMLGDDVQDDLVKQSAGMRAFVGSNASMDIDEKAVHPLSRKSESLVSVDSMKSTQSPGELNGRKTKDDREYKRKKLDKIQQFLGEKITSKMVEKVAQQPSQSSQQQQAIAAGNRLPYIRRLNKLQSVFGEVPPTQIVAQGPVAQVNNFEAVMSILEMLGGEAVVSYLLSHDAEMRELLQVMEDFDRQEGVSALEQGLSGSLNQFDKYGSGSQAEKEEDEDDALAQLVAGDDGSIAKKVNQARQRRRIGKLTKFFGSPAGAISSELSIEEKVFEDVARHFKSLMDPQLVKHLSAVLPSDPQLARSSVISVTKTSNENVGLPTLKESSDGTPTSSATSTNTSVQRSNLHTNTQTTLMSNQSTMNNVRAILTTPVSSKTNVQHHQHQPQSVNAQQLQEKLENVRESGRS